jgi:hypothetical protein
LNASKLWGEGERWKMEDEKEEEIYNERGGDIREDTRRERKVDK